MTNVPEQTQRSAWPSGWQRSVSRPWFAALKEYIYETTTAAAADYWPPRNDSQIPYYNYRLEHILQVERDALQITSVEHGNSDVILAAVWAHDRFQPQFEGDNHAQRAAEWAKDYLKFIRFPDSKIREVCQAVQLHSHKAMDIPEELHEARILWDADHVARSGPVDIINYMLCHSAEGFLNDLPNNDWFPTGAITVRDFVPLLMERRPQMYHADWFYFDETRRMARERITASRVFLDCLEGQVQHLNAWPTPR
jgi:hypothetical protein